MSKNKREDAHYLKYRNSDHLAGIDVEIMKREGKSTILQIEDAYYSHEEKIKGVVRPSYIVKLKGIEKKWIANSGNRAIISKLAMVQKGIKKEDSEMTNSWVGVNVELFFDPMVKMGRELVGGIVVSPVSPIIEKPPFKEDSFQPAYDKDATWEIIEKHYSVTPEIKQKYEDFKAKK